MRLKNRIATIKTPEHFNTEVSQARKYLYKSQHFKVNTTNRQQTIIRNVKAYLLYVTKANVKGLHSEISQRVEQVSCTYNQKIVNMSDSYSDSIQDYNQNVNDTNTDSITDFNLINDTANFNNSTILNPEIGDSLRILQLNIEGISAPKCEVLENVLYEKKIDAVAFDTGRSSIGSERLHNDRCITPQAIRHSNIC